MAESRCALSPNDLHGLTWRAMRRFAKRGTCTEKQGCINMNWINTNEHVNTCRRTLTCQKQLLSAFEQQTTVSINTHFITTHALKAVFRSKHQPCRFWNYSNFHSDACNSSYALSCMHTYINCTPNKGKLYCSGSFRLWPLLGRMDVMWLQTSIWTMPKTGYFLWCKTRSCRVRPPVEGSVTVYFFLELPFQSHIVTFPSTWLSIPQSHRGTIISSWSLWPSFTWSDVPLWHNEWWMSGHICRKLAGIYQASKGVLQERT